MISALEKAQAAMEAAKALSSELHIRDMTHPNTLQMQKDYLELTTIASIQAQISQAESMQRIANVFEKNMPLIEHAIRGWQIR